MCPADNEKSKKTNIERNRTAKSRKNQNVRRKRKLQALGNRGGHHKKQRLKKKSTSNERDNFSKLISAAKISSKQ